MPQTFRAAALAVLLSAICHSALAAGPVGGNVTRSCPAALSRRVMRRDVEDAWECFTALTPDFMALLPPLKAATEPHPVFVGPRYERCATRPDYDLAKILWCARQEKAGRISSKGFARSSETRSLSRLCLEGNDKEKRARRVAACLDGPNGAAQLERAALSGRARSDQRVFCSVIGSCGGVDILDAVCRALVLPTLTAASECGPRPFNRRWACVHRDDPSHPLHGHYSIPEVEVMLAKTSEEHETTWHEALLDSLASQRARREAVELADAAEQRSIAASHAQASAAIHDIKSTPVEVRKLLQRAFEYDAAAETEYGHSVLASATQVLRRCRLEMEAAVKPPPTVLPWASVEFAV
jgi:hypothetical protein